MTALCELHSLRASISLGGQLEDIQWVCTIARALQQLWSFPTGPDDA